MKSLLIALGLALALLVAQPVLAASVRVDFSGTVVGLGLGDEPGDLASDVTTSVSIGTPFAGFFTFEDSDLPYASTDGEADYAFVAPPWTLDTTLGDYLFQPTYFDGSNPTPPPGVYYTIAVYDSVFGDGVTVGGRGHSSTGAGADSFDLLHTQLDMYASPGLLSSTALAGVPWDLSLYDVGQVNWFFERGDQSVEVSGAIDALSVSVPEPANAALSGLLALVLTALGFLRARS